VGLDMFLISLVGHGLLVCVYHPVLVLVVVGEVTRSRMTGTAQVLLFWLVFWYGGMCLR
jgi:hypothetical protein